MTDPAATPAPEQTPSKRQRRRATVLVSVPGWPSQDPGRLMIWRKKENAKNAASEVKRMQRYMPDCVWSMEMLTATEARKVRLKPFSLREQMARETQKGS